jgi:hypothetical protein
MRHGIGETKRLMRTPQDSGHRGIGQQRIVGTHDVACFLKGRGESEPLAGQEERHDTPVAASRVDADLRPVEILLHENGLLVTRQTGKPHRSRLLKGRLKLCRGPGQDYPGA